MTTLPIHELFLSWQGEGIHMGRRAFFIRTYGCPVQCDFCDSAGTWHPDHRPAFVKRFSTEQLVQQVVLSGASICIVTGGEPAIHPLREFAQGLAFKGIAFHIETSGAVARRESYVPEWTTLSPKWAKLPEQEWWDLADELKLIITTPEEIWQWITVCQGKLPIRSKKTPVWLHPEWSKAKDKDVLSAITDAIKISEYPGMELRAGFQLHKLYKADQQDSRSASEVPLGGRII